MNTLSPRRTRAYFREDAILTLRGLDWDEGTSAQDPVVFEYLNSEVPERMSVLRSKTMT